MVFIDRIVKLIYQWRTVFGYVGVSVLIVICWSTRNTGALVVRFSAKPYFIEDGHLDHLEH